MEIYDYSDDEILALAIKAFANMEQGCSFVHVKEGTIKASRIIYELTERFKMLKTAVPKKVDNVSTLTDHGQKAIIEPRTNKEILDFLVEMYTEDSAAFKLANILFERLEKADGLNKLSIAIHESDTQKILSLEKLIIKTLLENN